MSDSEHYEYPTPKVKVYGLVVGNVVENLEVFGSIHLTDGDEPPTVRGCIVHPTGGDSVTVVPGKEPVVIGNSFLAETKAGA